MRIIAGPCQHESILESFEIASHCRRICKDLGFDYYFKASFDKANRSSKDGIRGIGFDKTMKDFYLIKEKHGNTLKILTDVHTVEQVESINENHSDVIDVLQIPAFLCRQTDLVQAACATGKIVNIKKGQFLAPWDIKGILSKTVKLFGTI